MTDRRAAAATWGALLAIMALSFWLRAVLPHAGVFPGDYVRFQGNDAWYHMRLADSMLHHYPVPLEFDPYAAPAGARPAVAPFPDFLLVTLALAMGLGAPSPQFLDAIGAWLPALMGVALALPVFLLGKQLGGRGAGLLAALFVAVLPGRFFISTRIGTADHHVIETLLATLVMLLFMRAVTAPAGAAAVPSQSRPAPWRLPSWRSPPWGLAAGVVLGLYLLSWVGGAFLVLVLGGVAGALFITDHLVGGSGRGLLLPALTTFAVAFLLVVLFPGTFFMESYHLGTLVAGLAGLPLLAALAWRLHARKTPRWTFPIIATGLAATAAALLTLVRPGWWHPFAFHGLGPRSGAAFSVAEVRPLFHMGETFSLAPAYGQFGALLFVAPLALLLQLLLLRRPERSRVIVVVWSLAMLAAAVAQTRFVYYAAINVALLGGDLCWNLLAARGRRVTAWPRRALGILLIAAAVYSGAGLSIINGMQVDGPDRNWHEAMTWMRNNTQEPMGDAESYTRQHRPPAAGPGAPPHATPATLMNWWDSGYWIIRMARRIPVSNPTQAGAGLAGRYFTAGSEADATAPLQQSGASHVVVDSRMPLRLAADGQSVRGQFPAMGLWAGHEPGRYFERLMERRGDGSLAPVYVFFPDYYRSMMARLALYAGAAVTPDHSTWVIGFAERRDGTGRPYRELTSRLHFSTYEEARAHLDSVDRNRHLLVGLDPMATCVPLEALAEYRLVHRSAARTRAQPAGASWVQIFAVSR